MKKLILKETRKEVKEGDVLYYKELYPNTSCNCSVIENSSIVLTELVIYMLIQIGIIEVVEEENTNELVFYIQKIANRLNWKLPKVYRYLINLGEIQPSAVLSVILREIAIELDKKYTDHIQDSKDIYAISLIDGKIYKVHKAAIKNYRNFAAFRTEEDAKSAYKIVKNILKNLFKSDKQ